MDINEGFLVGRLTRDMELRYTDGGFCIGSFSIAVGEKRKSEDVSHFFDCTLLGDIAGKLSQYLTKGKQVAITYALQQDRWEKDGQKNSKVKLLVKQIQMLGGGKSQQEDSSDVPF